MAFPRTRWSRIARAIHHADSARQALDELLSAAVSPNGTLVATDDTRRSGEMLHAVYGPSQWQEVHEMKVADGLLADLAFSPKSGYLATAGADRTVCLFRMRDGRRMVRQSRHSDAVLCIAWRSASHLVSSGADGRILHWKTSGSREAELPRVRGWVYDVAASTMARASSLRTGSAA